MKTMKDFAKHQLTKKQMNCITGGAPQFFCTCNVHGAKSGQTILWTETVYVAGYIEVMINQHCVDGGTCRAMNV